MRITADTNVLLRAMTRDDAVQARVAEKALAEADAVILPLPVLCELAWVLRSGYRRKPLAIARSLRQLLESASTVVDGPAVRAGIETLEAGGDFADGVIAYLGAAAGGEAFATFDVTASDLLSKQGFATLLLP